MTFTEHSTDKKFLMTKKLKYHPFTVHENPQPPFSDYNNPVSDLVRSTGLALFVQVVYKISPR